MSGIRERRDRQSTPSPELQTFLRDTLPDFMVPDAFVWLDRTAADIERQDQSLGDSPAAANANTGPPRSTPRTPTERIVAEIWAEHLGLLSVGIEDNFFERGGHSLLAVSMIAALETRFGVPLPPALLFKAPTVSALAKAVDAGHAGASRAVGAGPDRGPKPPIFALPGGGGSVIAYAQLARDLGRNQPFYGLEHPGLNGGNMQPDRVESVAGSFVEEMRNLHPGRPCVLIGACSGSIVAFELAR